MSPAAEANKARTPPKLVYATTKNIHRRGHDVFEAPETLFRINDHAPQRNITALDVNYHKNMVFWADSSGDVRRMTLEETKGSFKQYRAILRGGQVNLTQINHISVDWLNDKLYVAGNSKLARFNYLEGQTVSYEVLIDCESKPLDLHVDPLNGYLFFTLSGPPDSMMAGLYRVDLSLFDKRTHMYTKPLSVHHSDVRLIIREPTISVFVVDYADFHIYYPRLLRPDNTSTIISSMLDGTYKQDMRADLVHASKFGVMQSIAHFDKTFAWTNGSSVLLMEEFNPRDQKYYHNEYHLHYSEPIVALSVWHADAQPYPRPRNPPRELKSLFLTNEATVIWSKPALLVGRSEGAWQKWVYEMSIRSMANKSEEHIASKILTERVEIKHLTPGTEYVIRVRAISPAGKGDWSDVLINKTLKETELPPKEMIQWGRPPVTPEIKEDELRHNRIAWNAAESYGATTVSYELQIREADADKAPWRTVYNGTHLQYNLSRDMHMLYDHTYNLRLRARSEFGEGDFSKRNVTFRHEGHTLVRPTASYLTVAAFVVVLSLSAVLAIFVLLNGKVQVAH